MEFSNDTFKVDHFNVLLRGRRGFNEVGKIFSSKSIEADVLWRISIIIVIKQVNGILP